jgi:putative ABC transport system permease protein
MLLLKLGFRNLLRARRRSAYALAAVAFGVVAILLSEGFTEWQFFALREATIRAQLGHIQIAKPQFHEKAAADPESFIITPPEKLIAEIEALPDVSLLTPRLNVVGLASTGEYTLSFLGEGVHPEKEQALSDQIDIVEGRQLDSGQPGVLLGEGLAKALQAKIGTPVVLMVNPQGGALNALELPVRGVFRSNVKAFDDIGLRLNIDQAQKLIRTKGAHVWVLLLNRTENTDATFEAVQEILARDEGGLEAVAWHKLSDFYNKTVRLFSRQILVVNLLIQAIVVLSVSTLMVMSVAERTGEIGTVMALGTRRRTIMVQFLIEGALLGLAGSMIGLTLGFALAQLISWIGIPQPPPPGSNRAFVGQIFVTPWIAFKVVSFTTVAAVLASFFPAAKAAKLEIVDALRASV